MTTAILWRTAQSAAALPMAAVGIGLWAIPAPTAVVAQDGPGGEADIPATCLAVTNLTGQRTATGDIRLSWTNPAGGRTVLTRRFAAAQWSGGRNLGGAYGWRSLSAQTDTSRTATSRVITGTNQSAWYRYQITNSCQLSNSSAVTVTVPPVPENMSPSGALALGGSSNIWTVPRNAVPVYMKVDYAVGSLKDALGDIEINVFDTTGALIWVSVIDSEDDSAVLRYAASGYGIRIKADKDAFDTESSLVNITFHRRSSTRDHANFDGAVLAKVAVQKERRPSKPVNGSAATNTDNDSITLTWSKGRLLQGAKPHHYEVRIRNPNPPSNLRYRNTSISDSSNPTTLTITKAKERELAGKHTAEVRHCNAGGGCSEALEIEFTFQVPTPDPTPTTPGTAPAPTSVTTQTGTLPHIIWVSWNRVAGATRYKMEVRADGTDNWTEAYSGSRHIDKIVSRLNCGGTKYFFRVSARGDGMTLSETFGPTSKPVSETTISCWNKRTPTNLRVTATAATSASLAWKSSEGAHRYRVEYRKSSSSDWTEITDITGTTRTVTGLTCNTAYQFRVSAKGDGQIYSSSYTAASTATSTTTGACAVSKPPAPTGLTLNFHPTAVDRLNFTYQTSSWTSGTTHYYQFRLQQQTKARWDTLRTETKNSATAQTVTFETLTTGENYRASGRRCAAKSADDTLSGCSDWGSASSTIYLPPLPPAPTGLKLAVSTTTATTLTLRYTGSNWNWNGATEHHYQFELNQSDTPDSTPEGAANKTDPGAAVSFTNAIDGKGYQARGRRCTYVGYTRCGSWSAWVALPPPPTMGMFTPHATDTQQLVLSYTQADRAIHHYRFQLQEQGTTWADFGTNPRTASASTSNSAAMHNFTGLNEGGKYRVRGRRCATTASDHCGFWTSWTTGQLNKLNTPIPDIRPFGHRLAIVIWPTITEADQYIISPDISINGDSPTSIDWILVDLNKYFTEHGAPNFTVKAVKLNSNYANSDVISSKIIDTPIITASGDSRGITGFQAEITWHIAAMSNNYELKYLEVANDTEHNTFGHWEPKYTTSSWNVPSPGPADGDSSFILSNLDEKHIYAVQINYTDKDGSRIFSGLPAFVWPSKTMPGPNERVAGFPFFGHWPDKEYNYIICEDTLPPNERTLWVDVIEDAFEQWEISTNKLITMTPERQNCFAKPGVIARIGALLEIVLITMGKEQVQKSEVYMANINNLQTHPSPVLYRNLVADIHSFCIFFASSACVASNAYGNNDPSKQLGSGPGANYSVDVIIRSDIEGELDTPTDVKFDYCLNSSGDVEKLRQYETMIHEAGHALGLSAYSIRKLFEYYTTRPGDPSRQSIYSFSHPDIHDSVMNYGDTSNCSPNAIDIMAIHALYQTLDP